MCKMVALKEMSTQPGPATLREVEMDILLIRSTRIQDPKVSRSPTVELINGFSLTLRLDPL